MGEEGGGEGEVVSFHLFVGIRRLPCLPLLLARSRLLLARSRCSVSQNGSLHYTHFWRLDITGRLVLRIISSTSATQYRVVVFVFLSRCRLRVEWDTRAFGLLYFAFTSSYILPKYKDTANISNTVTNRNLGLDGIGGIGDGSLSCDFERR
jgi:hypothetical protein